MDIKALINGQTIPMAYNPSTGEYQEIVIAPDSIYSATYPVMLTATDEAGNQTTASTTINVVPQWITPKTNWLPTDPINTVDWRRIMGNMAYLYELAIKMYPKVPWIDMGLQKTVQDWPQATEWNAIEDNLESLKDNTYPLGTGKVVTFEPNGYMIDFIELNRIEGSILKFYIGLMSQHDCLKTLSFTLGGDDFGN